METQPLRTSRGTLVAVAARPLGSQGHRLPYPCIQPLIYMRGAGRIDYNVFFFFFEARD